MSEARDLLRKIEAAVLGLGETGDQIAETLRLDCIRGIPEDGLRCALSAYVHRHYPEAKVSTLDPMYLYVGGERATVQLPKGHTDFMVGFDSWQYPELIDTDTCEAESINPPEWL